MLHKRKPSKTNGKSHGMLLEFCFPTLSNQDPHIWICFFKAWQQKVEVHNGFSIFTWHASCFCATLEMNTSLWATLHLSAPYLWPWPGIAGCLWEQRNGMSQSKQNPINPKTKLQFQLQKYSKQAGEAILLGVPGSNKTQRFLPWVTA